MDNFWQDPREEDDVDALLREAALPLPGQDRLRSIAGAAAAGVARRRAMRRRRWWIGSVAGVAAAVLALVWGGLDPSNRPMHEVRTVTTNVSEAHLDGERSDVVPPEPVRPDSDQHAEVESPDETRDRLLVRPLRWSLDLLLEQWEQGDAAVKGHALGCVVSRDPRQGARLFRSILRALRERTECLAFLEGLESELEAHSIPILQRALRVELRSARISRSRYRDSARVEGWIDEWIPAIGRSHGRAAWPLLEVVLEERGPDLVNLAACAELAHPESARLLGHWMGRADPVGGAAIEALACVPGPEPVRLLLAAYSEMSGLSTGSDTMLSRRQRVLAAALRRQESEALSASRHALQTHRALPTTVAVLAELFPDVAARELAALLGRVDRRVAALVLKGLSDLGTPRAIEALIRALEQPQLANGARRHLARIARKDFGNQPERCRVWLEERSGPARPMWNHALANEVTLMMNRGKHVATF